MIAALVVAATLTPCPPSVVREGEWIVSATTTATVTQTAEPTASSTPDKSYREPECVEQGHRWGPSWATKTFKGNSAEIPYFVSSEGRLSLNVDEWAARSPEERERKAGYVEMERCRRCGLWREKP